MDDDIDEYWAGLLAAAARRILAGMEGATVARLGGTLRAPVIEWEAEGQARRMDIARELVGLRGDGLDRVLRQVIAGRGWQREAAAMVAPVSAAFVAGARIGMLPDDVRFDCDDAGAAKYMTDYALNAALAAGLLSICRGRLQVGPDHPDFAVTCLRRPWGHNGPIIAGMGREWLVFNQHRPDGMSREAVATANAATLDALNGVLMGEYAAALLTVRQACAAGAR